MVGYASFAIVLGLAFISPTSQNKILFEKIVVYTTSFSIMCFGISTGFHLTEEGLAYITVKVEQIDNFFDNYFATSSAEATFNEII